MSKHISKEKIEELKKQLLELKEETETLMEGETEGPNDSVHALADYDNHPGDMGTEQFEQERDAGLQLVREDRLAEINDALQKIDDGTYGLSEKSGEPIPVERLEVYPAARNLVEEEESDHA